MANHGLQPQFQFLKLLMVLIGLQSVFIAFSASAQPATVHDLVAIVHPSNEVASLSVSDMRDIFLVDQKKWSRTSRIHPILPQPNSATMSYVVTRILGMSSESELSMYYMAAIFQQKIGEPSKSANDRSAIAVVRSDPGAIAIVSRSSLSEQSAVRIIEISDL